MAFHQHSWGMTCIMVAEKGGTWVYPRWWPNALHPLWVRRNNEKKKKEVWKGPLCWAPNLQERAEITCLKWPLHRPNMHVVFAPSWVALFVLQCGPLGSCGLVQGLDFGPLLTPFLSLPCSVQFDTPFISFIIIFVFPLMHSFNRYLLTCLLFLKFTENRKKGKLG